MKLLKREDLLKRDNLEITRVELGGGEFVFVRQMTGRERDSFEQSLIKPIKGADNEIKSYERSMEDFRAKLAVVVLCDENGESLLQPEDYPLLSQSMSAKRLEKIVNVAQRLNKITDEDKEALIKNSDAGQPGNSSSDSAVS